MDRNIRAALATAATAIGFLAVALDSQKDQLAAAFPGSHWLTGFLAVVGVVGACCRALQHNATPSEP